MKNIVLFVLLFPLVGLSQDFFISTSENKIYQLDADYNATLRVTVDSLDGQIYDIAFAPDGTLYGVVNNMLIEISLEDGSHEEIVELSPSMEPAAVTSLTCNSDYELIFIDNGNFQLLKYDLLTDAIELIDTNDAFNTPGDVTLYRGNVLFPNFPYLKAYNLLNGTISNIACLPEVNGLLWGIATDFNSCDTGQILAVNVVGEVWEFGVYEGLVNANQTNPPNLSTYGMASVSEHLFSECNFVFKDISCISSTEEGMANGTEYQPFPNPFRDQLSISNITDVLVVALYNIEGTLVYQAKNEALPLEVSFLPTGCYFLRVTTTQGVFTRKVVKQ